MRAKIFLLTRAICSEFVPLTTKVSTVGGNSRNLSLNGSRAMSIFSAVLALAAIHSSASAVQLVDAISASRLVLSRIGFPAWKKPEKQFIHYNSVAIDRKRGEYSSLPLWRDRKMRQFLFLFFSVELKSTNCANSILAKLIFAIRIVKHRITHKRFSFGQKRRNLPRNELCTTR